MSWSSLQKAIQAMPPTGANGFEGVIALALSRLLARQFLLSRTGDQQGIDGRDLNGAIMMQGKRYTSTRLTESQVETDFHAARRSFPQMEVYVLGVSRTTAQLMTRLEQLRQDTGIDLVAIDWQGAVPPLGALL